MKLIKRVSFVTVRLLRCFWVLFYCGVFVFTLVQAHALIADPVAIPHLTEVAVNAFDDTITYLKSFV